MKPVKPFSEACERNREPILAVLREAFAEPARVRTVLEIGSGTGQHAVYFAEHLPDVAWQCSDLPEHHPGINAWIDDAPCANVLRPLALDVREAVWPVAAVDAVYTANTLHIMDSASVEATFRGIARVVRGGGVVVAYGAVAISWNGVSIRDFEAVDALARGAGLTLVRDVPMPANNRTLVWRKTA